MRKRVPPRSRLFTAIEQTLAGKTYITPLVTKGVPLDVFLRQAVKPGVEKLTRAGLA